jgi:hypothetical protein
MFQKNDHGSEEFMYSNIQRLKNVHGTKYGCYRFKTKHTKTKIYTRWVEKFTSLKKSMLRDSKKCSQVLIIFLHVS